MVTEARSSGRVVELLPNYRLPEHGIFAVYPETRHVPAKVSQFVEFLRTRIGS